MTVQRWNRAAIALLALSWMLCASVPALAQTAVSSGDIQRLQDEVYQANADVSRLRTTDALQAGRLQDDLDRLREDVIYLKVKLRKESSVSRSEYRPGSRRPPGAPFTRARRDASTDLCG